MGLYDIKKSIEALYYKHCIRHGTLPLPDLVYYHWDKKRIAKSLNSCVDRGNKENVTKQRKITKKRKEKTKKA